MLNRYFKARPGAREKVFLATKFGITVDAAGDYVTRGDHEQYVSHFEREPR